MQNTNVELQDSTLILRVFGYIYFHLEKSKSFAKKVLRESHKKFALLKLNFLLLICVCKEFIFTYYFTMRKRNSGIREARFIYYFCVGGSRLFLCIILY